MQVAHNYQSTPLTWQLFEKLIDKPSSLGLDGIPAVLRPLVEKHPVHHLGKNDGFVRNNLLTTRVTVLNPDLAFRYVVWLRLNTATST
jgi:hypothetical protein